MSFNIPGGGGSGTDPTAMIKQMMNKMMMMNNMENKMTMLTAKLKMKQDMTGALTKIEEGGTSNIKSAAQGG
jgi:hypothetical protein